MKQQKYLLSNAVHLPFNVINNKIVTRSIWPLLHCSHRFSIGLSKTRWDEYLELGMYFCC